MNEERNTMEQEEVLICECCNYIIDDDDYTQSVIAVVLESGERMHIAMKIPLFAQIAMKSTIPDAAAVMPCFMRMKHTTRTVMHTVEIVMRKNGKTLT